MKIPYIPGLYSLSPEAESNINIKKELSKLVDISNTQSKTASFQFKTTIFLMIISLVFAIISALPIIGKFSSKDNNNIQYKNLEKSIIHLIELQQQKSEIISQMSLRLFDLQNRVQILESKNKELESFFHEK